VTLKHSSIFSMTNFSKDAAHPEIVVITSGKGGVGKSMISLNLSILLAQMKKKILLIDADLHLGNLNFLAGFRPRYTISDAIQNHVPLQEVLTKGPEGIDILPASSADMALLENENTILRKLTDAFSRFESNYDMVVVDTAAGIARNVLAFVLGGDKIIVVVTPDPASIADAYGMMKVIRQANENTPIMMVANMVASHEEGESLYNKMKLMVRRFLDCNLFFGGTLESDEQIKGSTRRQKIIALDQPRSTSANSLRIITRNLLKLPVSDADGKLNLFERMQYGRDLAVGGME